MTVIKKAILPKDERGNDPNDHRDDGSYLSKVAEKITFTSGKSESSSITLSQFALNGQAAKMKERMLKDIYVLGKMAILGQSTVFYAKPNAGKTLLIIWLIIDAIKNGRVNGDDVFYINADDNFKGLTNKLELAEKHGFKMLAPGYFDFTSDMLPSVLEDLIKADKARGKVLILDTVKKFTDIMRKDRSSAFGESIRQFVSHGGSVIMLAHVNKHRNDDGKVVFSGTSDLVDDCDCAYTLDVLSDDKTTGTRIVKFENFKSRGDVALEAVYEYNAAESVSYDLRLESVRPVDEEECRAVDRRRQLDLMLERNAAAISAIREAISAGINQKTALLNEARNRSGLSKSKLCKALQEHTGSNVADYEFWHLSVADKNAHIYQLNWGAQ